MADTEVKTLITVKADTAQAAAEMKKLAAATDATTASLKKQAEQAGLVGNKFSELGKSMVGLQMHDTFTKASKAVGEYTGGIVDLNAAYAGYQVGGVYGAVIGGIGVAAVKSAGILSGFGREMDKVWEEAKKSEEPLTAYNKYLRDTARDSQLAAQGLFALGISFAKTQKLIADAMKKIADDDAASDRRKKLRSMFGGGLMDRIGSARDRISAERKGFAYEEPSGGEQESSDWASKVWGDKLTSPGAALDGKFRKAKLYIEQSGAGQRAWEAKWNKMLDDSAASATKERGSIESSVDIGGQLSKRGAAPGVERQMAQQSFMEQKFGPVGQFDAYASAFQGFSGAVVSGYDAMVDGTMSFGAAFKKSIAGALKALGGQMLVESLKETAYGVAAIASGYGFAAAAPHFKSAALFGAAAVAAGVAAHGLGGGGGSTASASAPNVGSSGASSSSGQATTQTIIVYGDALAENSPRGQQVLAKKIIQKALGSTAVEAS